MLKKLKNMKPFDIFRVVVGAIFFLWFLFPAILDLSFNLGSVAGMMFFGVLFWWGIFADRLRKERKTKKLSKIIHSVLIVGFSAFTLLFSVESCFMINAVLDTPEADSTLIVLGCAVYGEKPSQVLSLRIDAAAEFLEENPESKAVLSGGQGAGEDISEALCMYRELTRRGISEDRLFMEDKSVNTRENVAFSAEIIEKEGLNKSVAIVTNNFHLYRASLSVKAQGLECSCLSAFTPITLLPTYIMREYLGIVAQWIVG